MTQNAERPEKTAAEQTLAKKWRGVGLMCLLVLIACAFWLGLGALGHRGTLFMVANLAALAMTLVSMGFTLRYVLYERRSRAIRNLCRKCKYDLTGLDEPELCPECGTPISHPSDSTLP